MNKKVDKVCSVFLRRVVRRMKELGLNQSELAERMHVSKPYISKVLNQDVNFTFASAMHFAKALKMDFFPTLTPKREKPAAVRETVERGGFIASLTKNLFWDVDPETIDAEQHRQYVINRVLERGSLSDMRGMIQYYTMPVVVEEARSMRSLAPKALSFISCISNIPREQFRCYTSKPSMKAPWIS